MKWYEIILLQVLKHAEFLLAVIVFIGAVWLSMKAKDFQKNKYHNDSFKKRK